MMKNFLYFQAHEFKFLLSLYYVEKKKENIYLGNDVKCILFFHNISSTVLKSLYSENTRVILLTSKNHVY